VTKRIDRRILVRSLHVDAGHAAVVDGPLPAT
jgi:hypothetical protein